jgi:formate C-acetyltransferase
MQGRETRGLTSTLNSAAVVAQDFYYGGQALDLHLEPGIVENPADARKFQKALLTYFDMGGLQVQVNALSADALRKAFENPKAYNELTVRVGGYSARFNSLNKETQLEMIKRFERKL